MTTAGELAPVVGSVAACLALGVARATFYRAQQAVPGRRDSGPRTPARWALSAAEQQHVLAVLHEPAYVDQSPRTVFARLLDAKACRFNASLNPCWRLKHFSYSVFCTDVCSI